MTERLTPQQLADAIEKGKNNYPNVAHITGEYLAFDFVDDKDVPVAACALGFAMLGLWNGDIKDENSDEYIARIDEASDIRIRHGVHEYYLGDFVISENDSTHASLDEIVSHLRSISVVDDSGAFPAADPAVSIAPGAGGPD